jgi:hypothetical protein
MMLPQSFPAPLSMQSYPGPRPGVPFSSPPGQDIQAATYQGWNPAMAQQQAPPHRLARAQMEDEPVSRPKPVAPRPMARAIPSPEELGIAISRSAENASTDWSEVHKRLDQLGATCFHLEKSTGGCRITCLLPTAQEGRTHRIEAEASSEADAVRATLAQAEEWAQAQASAAAK